MSLDHIAEAPIPPERRLPFSVLLARTTQNPIAAWSRDFYEQPIVPYRWLGFDIVFVMDPGLIQTILLDDMENYSKSPVYDTVLGPGGGEGLLITEGEHWKWQRRLIAPIFRAERVEHHLPVFVDGCERLLAQWSAEPGAVHAIDDDVAATTLELLVGTLLGSDVGAEDCALFEDVGTAFLRTAVWKIAYSSLSLPKWTPHPGMLRMRKAARAARDIAERALARRRKSGKHGDDLLGRLMSAEDPATGERIPDRLIVDNIVTFLLAGHETTAKALTWTLHVLALMPEWQERARAEIETVIGDKPFTIEHLGELKLLETIFLEAMRLYPPAPSLIRVARKAAKLGDTDINAGAAIVIPIYVVHRHRDTWQDPLRFDPSRFDPQTGAKHHRCAYMPFGAGPRGCIGGSFSMLEGKAMLATLLAGARFALPPGELPTPVARITLHSTANIALKVTPLRATPSHPRGGS